MYTKNRERNANISLKKIIKSQGRRVRERTENSKTNQKTMNKMAIISYQ